jgi:hypothetical protein
MNERLKELWAQAGGHYSSGNQHSWPQYTIDNPEKFAELIVRECAGQCLSDDCMRILNHFGVEE